MVDGRWLWCFSGVNETLRLRIYTSVYDDDDSRMLRVSVYWQCVRPSKRVKCLRMCMLCSVLLELVLCVHMCVFILPLYRFSDLVLTSLRVRVIMCIVVAVVSDVVVVAVLIELPTVLLLLLLL